MLIGIDGNEANIEKRVGVSMYTIRLLEYFQKKSNERTQFVVYLRKPPRYDLPKQKTFFRYKIIRGPFMWSQFFLPLHLKLSIKKPHVFFSPAHYIPRDCPIPTVVTIHDVAYEYYPGEFLKKDLFKLRNWSKYALRRSKKIIAVSENTKKDVEKFYKTPSEKINVIYNGFSKFAPYRQDEVPESLEDIVDTRFILYVGTLQPRKNIDTLIDAYRQVLGTYPDLKLIIAGKRGWMYQNILRKVEEMQLTDRIIFTGYLKDEEIATLYHNAVAFILPSLYEGFGLPLLEAMYHECPVIASNNSSLPEVGGDACLYFDPKNYDELKQTIIGLIKEPRVRTELIRKGRERVKLFNWDKCGEETLKVLTSI